MAQVSLKSYENEMHDLIEAGAFDEAMAIGQHILVYYPKHLRTYGLLGESCLGKGLHQEAADLFLRVLSVDPENVAARVGLSRAYEAQGDIDNAVEQMRVAYDLAPSLAHIHTDLLTLLQQQSGGTAPKLKLTRQGLGRIYVRGELYTQAADEFEALLRESPDQVDTQVSLADALWKDGQRIRAIEVCQSVLNKLPYCLKAHLILAETWLRSDREDEAESHLTLIEQLDPDGDMAYHFMGDESPVPRVSVTLPDLESAAAREEHTTTQSEAATVELDETALPEWLRDDELVGDGTENGAVEGALESAELPAWLSAGGVGAVAALGTETDSTGDIEEIPEEGIPEWLQEAAPKEFQAEPTAQEATELSPGEPIEWPIAEEVATAAVVTTGAAVAVMEDDAEEPSATELDTPEEASSPKEESTVETESDFEAESEGAVVVSERIATTESEEPTDVELRDTAEQADEPVVEQVGSEYTITEGAQLEEQEPEPDWLRILREESPAGDIPPEDAAGVTPVETPFAEEPAEAEIRVTEDEIPLVAEEAELPDWLGELRESGGGTEDTLDEPSQPSVDLDGGGLSQSNGAEEETVAVDWLQDVQDGESTEAAPEQAPVTVADEVVLPGEDVEQMSPAEESRAGLPSEEDLEEIGLVPEGGTTEEEEGLAEGELPEWLRKAVLAEGLVDTSTETDSQKEGDAIMITGETAPSSSEEVRLAEDPSVTRPAADGETPEWLELLQREGPSQYVVPDEPESDGLASESGSALDEEDLEIPEWLQMLRQGQQEARPDQERVVDVSAGEEATELSGEIPTEEGAGEVAEEPASPQLDQLPESVGRAREDEMDLGEVFPDREASEAIVTEYKAMLEDNPDDYSTRWELVQACANAGDHATALEHGERLVRAGEFLDEIITYLQTLADAGGGTRQVYETLGEAYFKQDRFQEATEAYRKGLSQLG